MPLPLIGYGIAVVGKKTIFTVLAQVAKIIVALVVTTKTGEIQIKRVVPALYKIWVLNNEIKNECKKSNTTKQELKKVTKEANEIAKSLGQKKRNYSKRIR